MADWISSVATWLCVAVACAGAWQAAGSARRARQSEAHIAEMAARIEAEAVAHYPPGGPADFDG